MKYKIKGVQLVKRKFLIDNRGQVRHGFRASEGTIGEAYISTVNRGVVKAWHVHSFMTLRYLAVTRPLMVGLVDVRDDSPTFGSFMKLRLNFYGNSYNMLIIPPGVANGYRLYPNDFSDMGVLLNIPDMEHDPGEIERIPIESFPFPFDWGEYKVSG